MTPLFALLLAVAIPAEEVPARRVALVIARNDGGADRPRLRYAHDDARLFAGVLADAGGVRDDDVTLLLEPDAAALRGALGGFARSVAVAGAPSEARVEFIIYYSGHSDVDGIILGDERVSYRELRTAITAVPAAVRVVVLDSCASGAFTRLKGGTLTSPLFLDEASTVVGTAVLTSSSADESAQESERLKGSFFTHALVSGLRGAADNTGDGRVTLTEAYQFAFSETLARTERTAGGPQHAAFDIRLTGTGELVMTDLRQTTSTLSIPLEIVGRVFVRDPAGRLVAEVKKATGRVLSLAIEPGTYDIVVQGAKTQSARIKVIAGGTTLSAADFHAVDVEPTTLRGVAIDPPRPVPVLAQVGVIGGAALAAVGFGATVGLGAWALDLNDAALDPDGDPRKKQDALDYGPGLVVGVVGAASLTLIGAGLGLGAAASLTSLE